MFSNGVSKKFPKTFIFLEKIEVLTISCKKLVFYGAFECAKD